MKSAHERALFAHRVFGRNGYSAPNNFLRNAEIFGARPFFSPCSARKPCVNELTGFGMPSVSTETSTLDDASVNLVARWRQGDQQAAQQLFERYVGQLIALAR